MPLASPSRFRWNRSSADLRLRRPTKPPVRKQDNRRAYCRAADVDSDELLGRIAALDEKGDAGTPGFARGKTQRSRSCAMAVPEGYHVPPSQCRIALAKKAKSCVLAFGS